MSIETEIQRLQGIKSEIMAALERKNVDTTGKNISDVGDLIRSIEAKPIEDPILFATDFSSYDLSTHIDKPLVGGYGVWNSSRFYATSISQTEGPFNKAYASIYNYGSFPAMATPYSLSRPDESNASTLEFWTKHNTGNGLYVFGFGAIFILNRCIHLQINASDVECTLFNGATYHTNTSSTKIVKCENYPTTSWRHVANVREGDCFYLYVDGYLQAKFKRSKLINGLTRISMEGTGSAEITYMAQISLREGNYSNNNQSFPVPTEPYKV